MHTSKLITTLGATGLAAALVTGCTAAESQTTDPDPTVSAPAPDPDPTTPAPEPEAASLDDDEIAQIVAVLEGADAATIAPLFADQVESVHAASEFGPPLDASAAAADLAYVAEPATTWTMPLEEMVIDTYRVGYYADYFPDGAAVALSVDGRVAAFQVDEAGAIETVFMSVDEQLLLSE